MARPTIYSNEIIEKTKEYIDSAINSYEVGTRPRVKDGKHQGEEEYLQSILRIPTLEGLAFHLGIHKDTIQDWKSQEDKQEFSVLIDRLLQKQADCLISKGLSGEYNPTIAKVLLTKHGYREGTELSGTNGEPLQISLEDKGKIDGALDKIL